jgi:hypothetical protein
MSAFDAASLMALLATLETVFTGQPLYPYMLMSFKATSRRAALADVTTMNG